MIDMEQIKRVAIVGAGAMGAYFSSCFLKTEGIEVCLVARGKRLKRLAEKGLIVNGAPYNIPVINPDDTPTPFDLIIVALKHHHLPETLPDIQSLTGEQTIIISVMNGLDSEKIIGEACGMEHLLLAISIGIDAVREGNRVTYSNPGKHIFGEADNTNISQRVHMVQQAFDKAGIVHETPPDMNRILWWKFMVNVGVNTSSAVLGAPYGVFQTKPEARALMSSLMKEVITLAHAEGVQLTQKDLEEWMKVLHTLSPDGKTSMLQDIEAGAKTEIEIFCQKVVELGEKHNIPTPVNQTIMQIIKVLEQG